LINNGLGNPEHPNYGSWGGRYEYYTPRTQKWFYEPETRPFWTDAVDEVVGIDSNYYTGNKETIWRWRQAYQNDFAARMDWTVKPYKEANHPPKVLLSHPNELKATRGDKVMLNAEASTDPDGNKLSYEWIYYREVGTFEGRQPVAIENRNNSKASVIAPDVVKPETLHFIVAVTDNGAPALTRYQRVVVVVFPKKQ
ncbi:MAG: hypothetical protein ICV79_06595, partial [Flavisolibacter sp.]|nr:hypothetical protein [Flavisolibacter sp.]